MRNVKLEELDWIAGGRRAPEIVEVEARVKVMSDPQPLPPVNVIGYPPSGGGGGGGGGGGHGPIYGDVAEIGDDPGGGGYGGDDDDGLTADEKLQLALQILAQEIQAAVLDGVIPSNWIKTGVDIANLSADALQANVDGGRASWEMYNATGFSPNEGMAYITFPINWNNVDWSLFAHQGETYEQALDDMSNYVNSQHSGH